MVSKNHSTVKFTLALHFFEMAKIALDVSYVTIDSQKNGYMHLDAHPTSILVHSQNAIRDREDRLKFLYKLLQLTFPHKNFN